MREIAIRLLLGLGAVVLLVVSKATIRYCVTDRWLRISWLGLPVRWVRLTNIRQIITQRVSWTERWVNTFKPTNRYLLIRKHSGLFKNLVITPKNHMVFKADLERARSRLLPALAGDGAVSEEPGQSVGMAGPRPAGQ